MLLYSRRRFDARGRSSLSDAKHFSPDDVFGHRAVFRVSNKGAAAKKGPGKAVLFIEGLIEADKGRYKCRADFRQSPTKNYRINLKILSK